jgi:hypothetical protein
MRVASGTTGGGVSAFVADPDAYLAAILTPLKTWFGAVGNKINSGATLTYVKCNNIGPDGKYNSPTTHQVATSQTGGAGSPVTPAFCCVAFTWETGLLRGPAHRGRMYTPNSGWSVTLGTSQISTADMNSAASSGKSLLQALQYAPGGGAAAVVPVVASKTGALHLVTGCSVDNIMDVQRRRKNHLAATRSATVAFP